MKKIKLLVLMTASLYIPMGYQSYNIFNSSFDAMAQDISWGYFSKEEKEEDNVDSKIRETIKKMRASGVSRNNIEEFNPEEFSNALLRVNRKGEIQVYVYVEEVNEENTSTLREKGLRIEIANEKYKIVQGWLPFEMIDEVSGLDFVIKIAPPSYGTPRTGSIDTEGDAVLRSDEARDAFGVDGSGVDVCAISDGVDNRASAQSSGDLPDNITINPILPGSGDEGTAMLEIIHDIASAAALFFSGAGTSLGMIEAIKFCAESADIIVDDLGFLAEPYFEDGPVANEARSAVDNGKIYLTSAGNDASRHYQASYVDTNTSDNDNNIHDFGLSLGGESQTTLRAVVFPGSTALLILQWNDPAFGNIDGIGGSSNDYDLAIVPDTPNFDCPLNLVFADGIFACVSLLPQDGDDDPIEIVGIENTSLISPLFLNIVINRFSGTSRMLELFISQNGQLLNFNVPSDSIFGHPAVPGVIALGAVPSTNDEFCTSASNPNEIETFSSRGPVTISFPSFESREKPDHVAPDGNHITGAGDFGRDDGFGGKRFCGTSASSPHAAGVAALVLDADPTLTPSQFSSVLQNTAVDLGTPGPDNTFGFGRIDAFAAVQTVLDSDGGDGFDPGDANQDGMVTSADITCVILAIFEQPCPNPDCNGDGMVTSADITCVILEIFNQ